MHTVASSQRLAKKSNNEPVRMIAKRKRARDAALKMHNAKKAKKNYISQISAAFAVLFGARASSSFLLQENLCFNNWQCNCELC